MKQVLVLLALSILVTTGCSMVRHVPVPVAPDCGLPMPPVYPRLDPGEHIASPANTEKLMLILSEAGAYIKRQESTIKCFTDFRAETATEAK